MEEILIFLKIIKLRKENNTLYVGDYYYNRINPLSYICLVLGWIIIILMVVLELSRQTFNILKTGKNF